MLGWNFICGLSGGAFTQCSALSMNSNEQLYDLAFPGGSVVKNLPAMQEMQIQSLGWEDPLEKGIPTPVFLPEEFHGQRSLMGYSPWGLKESKAID